MTVASPTAAEAHAEMDDVEARLHALEVTAVRLAEERDTARGEAEVSDRIAAALKTQLHDAGVEIRGLTEQVVERTAERDLAKSAAGDIARALCDAERENGELRAAKKRWRRH